MDSELERELGELALACRVLAMEGHEDVTQGHLGLRDPQGRGVWLKRRGIGLGEVVDAGDFVLIDFDGNKLAGDGRPHSEWPVHTEVMLARPDVRVSAHTHPEYATLVAALDTEFALVTQEGLRIRGQRVARFARTADLIQTREPGRQLAEDLGDAWAILLRNHGLSFFAESVGGLALTGVFAERAARALIRLLATGQPIVRPRPDDIANLSRTSFSDRFVADNWAFLVRRLARHEGTAPERQPF